MYVLISIDHHVQHWPQRMSQKVLNEFPAFYQVKLSMPSTSDNVNEAEAYHSQKPRPEVVSLVRGKGLWPPFCRQSASLGHERSSGSRWRKNSNLHTEANVPANKEQEKRHEEAMIEGVSKNTTTLSFPPPGQNLAT